MNTNKWNEAEALWEKRGHEAAKTHPLKVLKNYPHMPGITDDTAKNLRWKSLKWMLLKDEDWKVFRHFFKKPFHYFYNYLRSLFSKNPFRREGDFFYYGLNSMEDFEKLLKRPNTLLVLGFSYCHKPFECPSGRFSDACIHDPENPVCQQCFIGKCLFLSSDKQTVPLYIPTVHYISEKILQLMQKHPQKQIIFLITACEMTLTMFADWGNMVGIQGVGVRLDGRICNTMRAFELSEEGIKPGLTVVLDETQKKMLHLLKIRKEFEVSI